VHDGITLEQAGVPTAVICTEPFVTSGEAMAKLRGAPDYPFATIPHPIGSLTDEGLKERAHAALPIVLQLLLGKA
jgi:hypothetical protein